MFLYQTDSGYASVRLLRSSNQRLLCVNPTRTVLASAGFKHYAVTVWNDLPVDIRNIDTFCCFRRRLKTFLFNTAFTT